MKRKLVGWISTCATPYCGVVYGYFCVRCRHFVSDCACHSNFGGCSCPDNKGWAGEGERKAVLASLSPVTGGES